MHFVIIMRHKLTVFESILHIFVQHERWNIVIYTTTLPTDWFNVINYVSHSFTPLTHCSHLIRIFLSFFFSLSPSPLSFARYCWAALLLIDVTNVYQIIEWNSFVQPKPATTFQSFVCDLNREFVSWARDTFETVEQKRVLSWLNKRVGFHWQEWILCWNLIIVISSAELLF